MGFDLQRRVRGTHAAAGGYVHHPGRGTGAQRPRDRRDRIHRRAALCAERWVADITVFARAVVVYIEYQSRGDMEPQPWLFDELAHAGGEHLDPTYVATYDTKAQTDPSDDLAVLLQLGLDHRSTLVDFGAGTGTFTLAAARVCRRVVAVDVSAAMLHQLHESARALDLANIECAQSGFLTYEHQGELADFAYSRNALHHLPDFWKALALRRVARTLKSGRILYLRDLVFSCSLQETDAIIESWLAGAPIRAADGFTASELATHVRDEYSTYSWLLEPMLERAGFEIRNAAYSPSQVFAAFTCVKP